MKARRKFKARTLQTILAGALSGTMLFWAQEARAQQASSQLAAIGVNAVVGGLIGSIGASRNHGSFWEGFGYGFLGGTITGAAKTLVGSNEGDAWIARVSNGIGVSMITNAAANRPPLSVLGFTAGPIYLEANTIRGTIRPYLEVVSTAAALYHIAQGRHFNSRLSLLTGSLVFTMDETPKTEVSNGRAIGNTLLFNEQNKGDIFSNFRITHDGDRITRIVSDIDRGDYWRTLRHDVIHTFQAEITHVYVPLFNSSAINSFSSKTRSWGLMTDYVAGGTYLLPTLFLPYTVRPHEAEAFGLAQRPTGRMITKITYDSP